MIPANQLRIGNWVRANGLHEGKLMQFKYFHHDLDTCFFFQGGIGEYLKDLSPIELSPEILEAAGFTVGMGIFSHLKIGSIYIKEGADWFFVKSSKGEKITTIKYTHQLQNLFFSLTGQELTINLNHKV